MIGTIIVFLIVLSVLVVAHEFGHYIMARKAGMTVEEFGIGFPPKIFGKKDKNGTLWSINAVPLGGFVRIKGEGADERDRFASGAFATKSIPWRFAVLVGGVVMNLIMAWVLFSAGFAIGLPAILEDGTDPSAIVSERNINVVEVLPNSPADVAGIAPGDEIVSIDGDTYTVGQEARDALAPNADGSPITFVISHAGQEKTIVVQPGYLEELKRDGVGIALVETGTVRYPVYLAPVKGGLATFNMTAGVIGGFWGLLTGLLAQKDVAASLSGPVGIAALTGQVLDLGFMHLVQFAAMLSVNLAVLNILPFPALDGGRILFLIIEAIRRKPMTAKLEHIIHAAGFAILILLVLFVTYRDIARLAG